jgi:hypothetical protein
MSLTKVILPVINNNPAGVVGCYLYHDSTITDLVYPTDVLFLAVGKLRESVDMEVGVTEYDNVDIDVKEDYTNHPEGFWHKLINGYPTLDFELMFTVEEDGLETFLFRGKIYRVNVEETEHYLDQTIGTPSVVVRGVKFKLVSSLIVLQNILIADLCTEALTHCTAGTITHSGLPFNTNCSTFRSILASMIKLGFGVAYDDTLVIDNATDIQVLANGEYASPLDQFIVANFFYPDGTIGGDIIMSQGSYYSRFATAYDLLKHIFQEWHWVPKYSFGDANGLITNTASDKPRIVLENRGRSGGVITPTGILIESTFASDTPRKAKNINAVQSSDTSAGYYSYNGAVTYGGVPNYVQIDINYQTDHFAQSNMIAGLGIYYLNGGAFVIIVQVRYWNYQTKDYVVLTTRTDANNFLIAAFNYLYNRFSITGRTQYTRLYGSLQSNNGSSISQRWTKTLAQTTISDGVPTIGIRDYYATEVEKDIFENKVQIIWVER